MVKVYKPDKVESVRTISPTKEERVSDAKKFREQKEHQKKIKDERFAAIRKRRKNNKPGGSGGGINIDVTSDS